MKKRNNLFALCLAILCVAFAVVLIFSEAILAHHECIDDHCTLCAISVSAKFVFLATVCALVSLTYVYDTPRAKLNGMKCLTLVSSKSKLTI